MERDLIPLAVLHSAGIMKLYLDEAYAVAPVGDAATEPRKVDPPAGDAGGCRVAGRRGGLGDLWIALCAMGLTLTIRRTR